ncbi:DUF488 domain-containing protein [Bacillus sp. 7894-2]|uniref:DUF488 domain-containing protein n=1 Tax=Bacillus sp. 7894-2 TaxID=2021695 RepID=UPI000BA78266|nr:DUF488 domain-containing protein [Bacillus sp. 7894-2]PAE23445.1 DNA repair protein [Bacillus sp. 7894-2]
MKVYTIGHYNHSIEQFLKLLGAAEINFVADVRAFPASRRSSHFKKENMIQWLKEAGIHYRHFPGLGGRRRISGQVGEQLNEGWNNRSFHNYADYTLTDDFQYALEQLKEQAAETTLVYMCSEYHPARCHRLLISNWLKANGWDVRHLIPDSNGNSNVVPHELGKWGAMPIIEEDGTVVYPKL